MRGERKIPSKDDIGILYHLITSLDEALTHLEKFYEKKDTENFNKTKRFMISLQEKISEVTQ